MDFSSKRIAFIRARWHADIVDQALAGFKDQAAEHGLDPETIEVIDAPGAFEMPLLAKLAAEQNRFDAIVAAAWVVDGGIYRHDFVAAAVVDGLMRAQLDTGVPVFSVSLTPHHFQESEFHHDVFFKHMRKKGSEAANACAAQLASMDKLAAIESSQR